MSILKWLGMEPPASQGPEEADAIREIASKLERLEPGHARFLALLAFLLARVANVDLDVSAKETAEMERIVGAAGGLPAPEASLVVEIAKGQNRLFGPMQNYLATRELRERTTPEEKEAILHCLFAVSGADDDISVAEEETIRDIAKSLLLGNDDYLRIRAAWREKRAVLKPGRRA